MQSSIILADKLTRVQGRRNPMSIALAWADTAKTVLNCVIESDFTGVELVKAAETYAAMVADLDHDFYLLADLSKATGNAIRLLGHFPQAARVLPPPERRARAVVAIGSSQAFDMVTHIFSQVYGAKFVYFTDANKAWAYLNKELGVE
jgi:hypothetical protein